MDIIALLEAAIRTEEIGLLRSSIIMRCAHGMALPPTKDDPAQDMALCPNVGVLVLPDPNDEVHWAHWAPLCVTHAAQEATRLLATAR